MSEKTIKVCKHIFELDDISRYIIEKKKKSNNKEQILLIGIPCKKCREYFPIGIPINQERERENKQ